MNKLIGSIGLSLLTLLISISGCSYACASDEGQTVTAIAAVRYSTSKMTEADIEKLCSDSSREEASLHGSNVDDAVVERVLKLPKLRVLNLDGTNISDVTMARISKTANLESLSLAQTKISPDSLKYLCQLQKLRSLNLAGTKTTSASLDCLSQIPTLQVLDLRFTPVNDLHRLGKCKSLTWLTLDGLKLSKEPEARFRLLPKLSRLSISRVQLEDTDIEDLARQTELDEFRADTKSFTDAHMEVTTHMPKLETLILLETSVTDNGLRLLSSANNLRQLNVYSENIRDGAFSYLPANLQRLYMAFPGQKNLGSCRGNRGFQFTTDYDLTQLKSLPNLERLSLSGSDLTDSGLRYISENCRSLKALDISDTWIQDHDTRSCDPKTAEHRLDPHYSELSCLAKLTTLEELLLYDNNEILRTVPINLSALKNLKVLHLEETFIESIPPGSLPKSLTALYIDYTRLSSLGFLEDLPALKHLSLWGYAYDLKDLSKGIQLEEIDFGPRELSAADINELLKLQNLTTVTSKYKRLGRGDHKRLVEELKQKADELAVKKVSKDRYSYE